MRSSALSALQRTFFLFVAESFIWVGFEEFCCFLQRLKEENESERVFRLSSAAVLCVVLAESNEPLREKTYRVAQFLPVCFFIISQSYNSGKEKQIVLPT